MDVVLFGTGKVAQSVYSYVREEQPFQARAFCVDDAFFTEPGLLGIPVIPFSRLPQEYPPSQCSMLVALGYHDLNRTRAGRCAILKAMGYSLQSYISPRSCLAPDIALGENCIVMPHASIEPFARLGDGVCVFDNSTLAHHNVLEDNVWVGSGVTVAGGTRIGANTFIGVGATVGHNISIGAFNFIGAGALLTHSTAPQEVHIAPDTPKYRLDSDAFIRLTHFS